MEALPPPTRRALLAYAGPFALFCLLLGLPGLCKPAHPGSTTSWWLAAPEFWVYPLQTLACGAMLFFYRREYPRAAKAAGLIFGAVVGLVVFVLWISPQAFFHFAPRVDGFNPMRLLGPSGLSRFAVWPPESVSAGSVGNGNPAYRATVIFRFLRLVAVVPWLEEVFWRGFLLRYLIKEDFLAVPFGAFTPLSFGVVTAGFMFEHSPADWPAALVTGVLYNWVAVRTRSLPACILAHALTNLLLGVYVMQTRQWGFW